MITVDFAGYSVEYLFDIDIAQDFAINPRFKISQYYDSETEVCDETGYSTEELLSSNVQYVADCLSSESQI